MPTFAENRSNLAAPSVLFSIGGIPSASVDDPNFQPSVTHYSIYDTLCIMASGANVSACDVVNAAEGDTVDMSSLLIPWPTGTGEVLTIHNSELRISRGAEVMLLRNGSPKPAPTLFDVFAFDSNVYGLEILPYGARLELKWGDALVVKSPRSLFHSVTNYCIGPEELNMVESDWSVMVCLPEFHMPEPEAYNALQVPCFCRQIRERVEWFVGLWDAVWDPTANRVNLVRNGPRQTAYVAMEFDVLELIGKAVKLVLDDPSEDDVADMTVGVKRLSDGEDRDGKRVKRD